MRNKWYDVNDCVPLERGEFLVTNGTHMDLADWDHNKLEWVNSWMPDLWVTHWMELPELPKKDDRDE